MVSKVTEKLGKQIGIVYLTGRQITDQSNTHSGSISGDFDCAHADASSILAIFVPASYVLCTFDPFAGLI
jgi:hypothetical protein